MDSVNSTVKIKPEYYSKQISMQVKYWNIRWSLETPPAGLIANFPNCEFAAVVFYFSLVFLALTVKLIN